MNDTVKNFYSAPSQQGAGALPVFVGSRRQIGGSFLSGLARFALPILKFLGGRLLNVAKNVVVDAIDKKPLRASLKERGLNELKNVMLGRGKRLKRIRKTMKHLPINKPKRMKMDDIFTRKKNDTLRKK